jgi:hypothetical protein
MHMFQLANETTRRQANERESSTYNFALFLKLGIISMYMYISLPHIYIVYKKVFLAAAKKRPLTNVPAMVFSSG